MNDVLLDLVRQYGDARWSEGTELDGGGSNWGAARRKADALLDRIAALIPQQPVQARDNDAGYWWLHVCGWVRSFPQPTIDRNGWCPSCSSSPAGGWRPLLVGGDPAPEQLSVPGSTVGPHRYERGTESGAERLKRHALNRPLIDAFNALAAAPGPLRLTLPEVPEGAVALIGVHRHVPEGNLLWWRSEQSGRVRHLGTLLTEEQDGVTVELAPPREPRTWPKLEGPPDGMRMAQVEGSDTVWYRELRGNRWLDGYGNRLTWSQLRASGKVTEVKE